jgi:hypothetical protein
VGLRTSHASASSSSPRCVWWGALGIRREAAVARPIGSGIRQYTVGAWRLQTSLKPRRLRLNSLGKQKHNPNTTDTRHTQSLHSVSSTRHTGNSQVTPANRHCLSQHAPEHNSGTNRTAQPPRNTSRHSLHPAATSSSASSLPSASSASSPRSASTSPPAAP